MTDDEAVKKLEDLVEKHATRYGLDKGEFHADADDILLEYLSSNGMQRVVDAYVALRTEHGFWYE